MTRAFLTLVLSLLLPAAALAQDTRAIPQRHRAEPGQRIVREVMHELLMNPYYTLWDDLRFRVDGSTVTLLGAVVNGAAKSDAVASVKKIEGVERVVDNIEILPPSPADDRIRRAEYRAIFGDPGLFKYSLGAIPSVHIIVKNGHVTLTGYVNSEADKNIAGTRAKGVPGTFEVINNLQVSKD